MTNDSLDHKQVERLCCGDPVAMHWIQLGHRYIHDLDDLIDVDIPNADQVTGAERVCRIGALAIELYTHPFFVKNGAALSQAMITNTNNYADSVRWEKSKVPWQRGFSDWARHGWIDVALVVAYICGGYANMRNESAELRALSYADHHDGKGDIH